MAEKTLKTRIIQKHDTEANWLLATNFTPMNGEIIIYDEDDNHDYKRIKIGNGTDNVNDLVFVVNKEDIPTQVQANWDQEDENALDYIQNRTHYKYLDELIPLTETYSVTHRSVDYSGRKGSQYEVTFNNVIYNVTAGDSGWIGNPYLAKVANFPISSYGIDPENNGLPFFLLQNHLFFTGTNTFDVDIKVVWVEMGRTILQQTISGGSSVYKFEILLPNQLLLVENNTYQLTVDDIKYSCVCKSHNNYLYLGNGSLVNSILTKPEIEEDNGQSFVLYMDGQSGPYFEADSPSVHNIMLEGEKVKQLSEEYVPDSIARIDYVNEKIENIDLTPYETTENASLKLDEAKTYADTVVSNKADKEHAHVVADITDFQETLDEILLNSQADWLVNDESNPAYIKNRPFYEESFEENCYSGELEFAPFADGSLYKANLYDSSYTQYITNMAENDVFVVSFDNIEYEVITKKDENLGVNAGNGSIFNNIAASSGVSYEDTGEPFLIAQGMFIFTSSTEATHNVSIIRKTGNIKTLESKYLSLPIREVSKGSNTFGKALVMNDYINNIASGGGSIASGSCTIASGGLSFAHGYYVTASGSESFGVGFNNVASGRYSVVAGSRNTASGDNSFAHGNYVESSGNNSFAFGNRVVANNANVNVIGKYNKYEELPNYIDKFEISTNSIPTTEFLIGDTYTFDPETGYYTIPNAVTATELVVGKYVNVNSSDRNMQKVISIDTENSKYTYEAHLSYKSTELEGKYVHVVGNGKSNEQRSNAYTLDYDGNAWYAGDVYVGGTSQNDGAKLITEAKVDEKISKINIPEQDLSNYALKSEIPSIAGLATETYADSAATQVKNDLLNGAGAAYDTLKELGDLIDVNVDAIEALETVASGKADKVHTHDQYLTEHQDISGKADKSELFSKSYNDLTNKPTLGSLAAKNTVVKSDLDSSIQTSLNKADTALQSFTETDPTVPAWAKEATKPTYTASEVGAEPAGAANDALEAAKAYAAEKTHTHYVKDITDFKATMNQYATNIYVDSQIANMASGLGGIPQYVYKGADMVANKVIANRNHASLVIGAMTDLHTSGEDDSATSVKHACFAMNEINKNTQLDLVAVLGDIMVDHMDSVNNPGFKYVKQQLDPIVKAVPFVQLEGNHDLDEVNTSADVRRQEYYAYIGANNVDVVTDFGNEFRNYGYKDFNNKRIRVVYLNTSDVAEEGMTTHLRISDEQFNWFINTALNFSNKEGASDWQVVVLTHIPLNYTNKYLQALLQLLKDYKDKRNGSISPSGTAINYDFRNNAQTFLCHIHGHIHNFRTEWFDNVLSITVPNACFGRNNEYGTSSSYDDTVHELYGDVDKDGNQRVYNKTMATVEDTAFSVFVIDGRINNKVHVYNYGAGIHRIIDLVDKSIVEEEINHYEGEGLTPNGDFVNAIPTSTTIGSTAVYNGKGYKNDTYVSSSGGVDSSAVGYVATGVMEYPVNDVYAHEFYILGADLDVTDSKVRIGLFNAEGSVRAVLSGESAITGKFKVTQLGDQYYKVEPLYNASGTPMIYASYGSGDGQTITGMRLSLKGIGQNLFVSMKNPIVAGLDGETVNWSAYTNVVPSSIDTEGEVFNGVGYKEGTRLNSSGAEASLARAICSGFIPYNNEDVRAYGARVENLEAGAFYVCFYNAAFEKIGVIPGREFSGSNPGLTSEMVDEKMMLTIDVSEVTNETFKGYMNDATYMRVSMSSCSGQVFVVTLNEKLILD